MLPKIEHPTFEVELPTTKQKIRMRPMLVKEEKILLMAKQTDTKKERFDAVRQIVNNCLVTELNADSLAMVDLEWLFLKLRAASISNIAAVSYRDAEDDKVYDVEVDLDKIELKAVNSDASNVIRLPNDINITLKYPSISVYAAPDFYDLDENDIFDRIVVSSLDKIFVGDVAQPATSYSQDELKEFVNELPATAYSAIRDYYASIPNLFYEIKYTNSKGTERVIPLESLDDFFMFV